MKKAVVGLGNPGNKYLHNRHNVGFQFLDFFVHKIAQDYSDSIMNEIIFEQNKYLLAQIAQIKLQDTREKVQVILAKPQIYMNKSGASIAKIVSNYKLQISNIYVVHDDLDIVFGDWKLSWAKGPQVHNGIRSIEASLRSDQFWRLRIGIDNRQGQPIPGEAYVLSDFTSEEKDQLNSIFHEIYEELINRLTN